MLKAAELAGKGLAEAVVVLGAGDPVWPAYTYLPDGRDAETHLIVRDTFPDALDAGIDQLQNNASGAACASLVALAPIPGPADAPELCILICMVQYTPTYAAVQIAVPVSLEEARLRIGNDRIRILEASDSLRPQINGVLGALLGSLESYPAALKIWRTHGAV